MIAVEAVWLQFMPLCFVLGKNICKQICLDQVEDLYHKVPYWTLQAIWENRTCPMNNDQDWVVHWPIDGVIENLQKRYKTMSFKNHVNDWVRHSMNVMLASTCSKFVNNTFFRRDDVSDMDEWNNGTGGTA